MSGRELGRWAEAQAARFLEERGYRILKRNYRTRRAEIDIVAIDGSTVVFVEVKGRRQTHFGTPWEAVDERKRRRLTTAAAEFLLRHPEHRHRTVRFDVVTVQPLPGGNRWRVDWLENAFSP